MNLAASQRDLLKRKDNISMSRRLTRFFILGSPRSLDSQLSCALPRVMRGSVLLEFQGGTWMFHSALGDVS